MSDSAIHTELYLRSALYAREHGELERYRASYRANRACRTAIEAAVRDHYRDNRLDTRAVLSRLQEGFSPERISYVLACTLRHKLWDGRFSRANQAWAETVPMAEYRDPTQPDETLPFLVHDVHPGLLNLLVTRVRKEEEQTHACLRKPSVLGMLRENAGEARAVPHGAETQKEAER